MPPPKGESATNGSKDSTANLGNEATAMRGSAILQSEAKIQVVSEAEDNMVALPASSSLGRIRT